MNSEEKQFNDFLCVWLNEVKMMHAPSTYVKYMKIAEKHIIPYFKGIALAEMTVSLLKDFRNTLYTPQLNPSVRKQPESIEKKLSDSMISAILMLINRVMREAFKQGLTKDIVNISIGLKRRKSIVKVFSAEDQTALECYIKGNLNQSTFCIYFCLYTGLRIGEACALKWENINLNDGYIHVKYTVQRLSNITDRTEQSAGKAPASSSKKKKSRLIMTSPKSEYSQRLVPIPSFLMPMFRTFAKDSQPENFILTGRDDQPMEPRTLQYQYKRCLDNASVHYLNFHSLRHTFATRCITAGIDPKTLSEILGHSDIKITMDYYFHSSFEFKKNQIDRLFAFA